MKNLAVGLVLALFAATSCLGLNERQALVLETLRALVREKQMPVSDWGWPSPIDRIPVDELVKEFSNKYNSQLPANASCLEWQGGAFNYSGRIPNCKYHWEFAYRDAKLQVDEARRVLYGTFNKRLVDELHPHFDVIVATQNLMYSSHPVLSMRVLHGMLNPGGFLVVSSAFLQKYDESYGHVDLLRYSADGLRSLVQQAGFIVRDTYVAGNTLSTIAFLLGYSATDLLPEERQGLLRTYEQWEKNTDTRYHQSCVIAQRMDVGAITGGR